MLNRISKAIGIRDGNGKGGAILFNKGLKEISEYLSLFTRLVDSFVLIANSRYRDRYPVQVYLCH